MVFQNSPSLQRCDILLGLLSSRNVTYYYGACAPYLAETETSPWAVDMDGLKIFNLQSSHVV
jgi:hypothetical protein